MSALKSEAAGVAGACEWIACASELARAEVELGVSPDGAMEALG